MFFGRPTPRGIVAAGAIDAAEVRTCLSCVLEDLLRGNGCPAMCQPSVILMIFGVMTDAIVTSVYCGVLFSDGAVRNSARPGRAGCNIRCYISKLTIEA